VPVAADVPALVHGAPVAQRRRDLLLRDAVGAVLGREDQVGRLPHHLVRAPAQDPLGAGAPRDDLTRQVDLDQHEIAGALQHGVDATVRRVQPGAQLLLGLGDRRVRRGRALGVRAAGFAAVASAWAPRQEAVSLDP
jgi:hypothetical protein